MNVLIIEDESTVALKLEEDIKAVCPTSKVIAKLSSCQSAYAFFSANPLIDIIFSDIRLEDGLSFQIFDKIRTNARIVFITAYDEYALKAFDYNCIDYLLKPVSRKSLSEAFQRYSQRGDIPSLTDIQTVSRQISNGETIYRKKLLYLEGASKCIADIQDICLIHTEHGYTRVFLRNGQWGMLEKSLTEISKSLNPTIFIRVNRQSIVNIESIDRLIPSSIRHSQLMLCTPELPVKIVISKEMEKMILSRLTF